MVICHTVPLRFFLLLRPHQTPSLTAATTTTTNRPSPPWLITSQPPVWSTVKPTSRPPAPPPRPSVTPSKQTTQSVSTEASSPSPNPVPAATDVADYSDGDSDDVRSRFDVIPGEITTLPYTTMTPKKMTGRGLSIFCW